MTREEAINKWIIPTIKNTWNEKKCEEILEALEQEPKTGHWIYSKAVNTGEIIFSECSVCGNGESRCAKRMNYCPNCGAKMESEE